MNKPSKWAISFGSVSRTVEENGRGILLPVFAIMQCRQSETKARVSSSSRVVHMNASFTISAVGSASRCPEIPQWAKISKRSCSWSDEYRIHLRSTITQVLSVCCFAALGNSEGWDTCSFWICLKLGQSNSSSRRDCTNSCYSSRCPTRLMDLLLLRYPSSQRVIISAMTLLSPSTCTMRFMNWERNIAHRNTLKILCFPKLGSKVEWAITKRRFRWFLNLSVSSSHMSM